MKRDIFAELMDGLIAPSEERLRAAQPCNPRIGIMKGKLVLPEDFDAPLPDDMLDDFESTQI
ncbi:hypothetical protein [Pseudomonas umsongensis]|jgi:hypothetical protein|uniref:hypothetical protein n=1 Tax=Pseudomonas umsongensis TaxID=198618 RepID=UPI0015BF7658|nr:hypothetical protein [Pseudomonas umsongensis]NWL19127.1 hypothetical protein [Pseudomonas umsongensis]